MRILYPFAEMEALRREIDRAFQSVAPAMFSGTAFLPGRSARNYPLINLSEDGDRFYIQALAPGIDPDKLNLTVVRNTLTISGEKSAVENVPAESFHRSERAAGKFVRSVELPVEVDADKVHAAYNNGLLTVTLAKAEAAKPRQIRVEIG